MFRKIKFAVWCFVAAICCTSSVFAQGSIWNSTDKSMIEKSGHRYAKIMLALIDKNSSNITYEQLKKIVIEAGGDKVFISTIPAVVWNSKRFNSFNKDVFNDPQFRKTLFVVEYTASQVIVDPNTFRAYFMDEENYILATVNPDRWGRFFKQYEKFVNKFTEEQVMSDMKSFKRLLYPKIENKPEWKKYLVKIELIAKSLQ